MKEIVKQTKKIKLYKKIQVNNILSQFVHFATRPRWKWSACASPNLCNLRTIVRACADPRNQSCCVIGVMCNQWIDKCLGT